MSIGHYRVKPGDTLASIATLIAPAGSTKAQCNAFATSIGVANGGGTTSTFQAGRVLHYDMADVPVASLKTGRFHTVGADIIDPAGQVFIPVGANVGAGMNPTYGGQSHAFTNTGLTATGHAADAAAWGWNIVRLNLLVNNGAYVSYDNMVAGACALIDEYTAAKIVVMPEVHDFTDGKGGNDSTVGALWAQAHTFWAYLLSRYKDNTYVWCDYVNEAFPDPDPSMWGKSGSDCYSRVRAIAPDTLFVWEIPVWAQDLEVAATAAVGGAFMQGKTNTVLGWHNYGALLTDARMSAAVALARTNSVPVMIGEVGEYWLQGAVNPREGAGLHVGQTAEERAGFDWTLRNGVATGVGICAWQSTGAEPADRNIYGPREGTSTPAAWYGPPTVPLTANWERLRQIGVARRVP